MLSLSWNIDAIVKVAILNLIPTVFFFMNEVSSINLRKIRIINNIDGSVEFGTASYIKLILIFKRYFWFLSTSWAWSFTSFVFCRRADPQSDLGWFHCVWIVSRTHI